MKKLKQHPYQLLQFLYTRYLNRYLWIENHLFSNSFQDFKKKKTWKNRCWGFSLVDLDLQRNPVFGFLCRSKRNHPIRNLRPEISVQDQLISCIDKNIFLELPYSVSRLLPLSNHLRKSWGLACISCVASPCSSSSQVMF